MASHLDITPSLVQLLRRHADMTFPANISWMGKGLDTGNTFKPGYEMPIMRNKNQLEDFIEGDVLLSANNLYRLKDGLTVTPLNNTQIKERLQAKLDSFRQLNSYLCKENKVFKNDNNATAKTVTTEVFSPEDQKLLTSISEGIIAPDTLFLKAREFAFAVKYKEARLLCRKVLAESPNYHDVRVLYGRTYAWDKKYAAAAASFKEVIRRDPTFEDAYLAWIDTEIWAGKTDSAALLVSLGLKALPKSAGLEEKKQKVQAVKNSSVIKRK
jgi:tetratricopeptide (TPR) repeat protein